MSRKNTRPLIGDQQPKSVAKLIFHFTAFGLTSMVLVLLAPSFIVGVPLVSLDNLQLLAVGLLVASYAMALLLFFFPVIFRRATHYLHKLLIVTAIFGTTFFLLYEYQNKEIAVLVMSTVLVSGLCLWASQRVLTFPNTVLTVFIVIAGILIWLTDFGTLSHRASGTLKTQRNIQTNFYNLQITTYPGRIPR